MRNRHLTMDWMSYFFYLEDLLFTSMRSILFISLLFLQIEGRSQTTKDSLLQIDTGNLEAQYDAYIELTNTWAYNRSDSAAWAGEKALEIAHQIDKHEVLAHAYKVAAIHIGDIGLYDVAIEYSYKSISYYDSSSIENKDQLVAGVYHNLAWYYAYMEDYSQTLLLFHKAMDRRADSSDLVTSFNALGSYYQIYETNYDSAIYYLEKSTQWRKMLGDDLELIAQTEVELCESYYKAGRMEEGDKVFRTLKGYDRANLSLYIQNYLLFLQGFKAHQLGEYGLALEFFLPVYQWGDSAQLFYSSTGINFMRQYVETHKLAGKHQQAFEMLEFLRKIEQETIYKDRQRVTKALEVRNETARKEQLLQSQETIISQQRRIILVVSVASMLVLALLGILLLTFRRIKKKNHQIETLMRELHHRVKNNLQVISSLLGLQSSKLEDAKAQKAVEEGQERIRAMSLIHQKLYQQDDVTTVNLKEYLETLVKELSESYGYGGKAQLSVQVPSIPMDVDTTMPIGLIVNELVSNSFKYAFDDIEKPMLKLEMIQKSNGHYQFSIKDNGRGLPQGFSLEEATSFGLKLVRLLVRQLGAKLEINQENGLEYRIKFSYL